VGVVDRVASGFLGVIRGSLISLALLLACIAFDAIAQAGAIPRIAVLVPQARGWDEEAFRKTLTDLGYREGVNLILDVRSAEGDLARLPQLATEIVNSSPRAIVAVNTPGTRAAIAGTRTIPIIMVAVGDPVGTGFVTNLARPEGNVTGVSNLCGELAAKRLSLLKEAIPSARRIAVMLNPEDPITLPQIRDAERAAPAVGVRVRMFAVRTTAELEKEMETVRQWRPDAAMWLCGQQRGLERRMIRLAQMHQLPVMPYLVSNVSAGGLIGYATNAPDLFRRAAIYVDRILKGAKPADLPVEQPTRFDLVINLQTAKTLGLVIPQSLLLRADELIQ